MLFVFSCRTEIPFDPDPMEPDPVDTMGMNPGDTIINPGDTLNMNPDDSTFVPCDSNKIYFERDILPIFVGNCALSGCHDPNTGSEGYVLNSYENLLKNEGIVPFDLDKSEIFEKVTEDKEDKRMPPAPNARLSADQIRLLQDWILQGARNDSCSTSSSCDTVEVSYMAEIQPVLNTYCVTCHNATNTNGGVNLTSHTRVTPVARSGKLFAVINWSTGALQMPLGGAKIPDCDIDKLDAWIKQGFLNN